jgi:hypothetical protein
MKKLILFSLLLNFLVVINISAQKNIGDKLEEGQMMHRNQCLTSPNGKVKITLNANGNLELTKNGQLMWESGTNDGYSLFIEQNGKVVLTDESGSKHIWETKPNEGSTLHIKDNGNLVTFKDDDPKKVSWSLESAPGVYEKNGVTFNKPVTPH